MCRVAENTRSPPRMTAEVTNPRAWIRSFCLLCFMHTQRNLAVNIDDAIGNAARWVSRYGSDPQYDVSCSTAIFQAGSSTIQ